MEWIRVVPKRTPSMWLDKDWKNRECKYLKGSEAILEEIHDFEVRSDDVWLVTLPKCGTTWMQEMTWLILNSFDFKKALTTDLDDRSPFLESSSVLPREIFDSIAITRELSSPRLIKTHLPLPLLPYQVWIKRPKIIYVFRNPKDAAVSRYYHEELIFPSSDTKEKNLKKFIQDNDGFWNHVLEFWTLRHEPNVFYTSFERMKSDLPNVLQDLCKFLNVPIDVTQMTQMLDHLSFENMKKNIQCHHLKETELLRNYFKGHGDPDVENSAIISDSANKPSFIRKGQVNGYTEDFSKELEEKYDHWIQDHLKPYNLTLDDLLLRSH